MYDCLTRNAAFQKAEHDFTCLTLKQSPDHEMKREQQTPLSKRDCLIRKYINGLSLGGEALPFQNKVVECISFFPQLNIKTIPMIRIQILTLEIPEF